MRKVVLKRIYRFTSAHRLNSYSLTAEQNLKLYDKCNNYNGHGHDYCLEVSINGVPDEKTGMVMPLQKLDRSVQKVLKELDYKHLNLEVDYFKDKLSSGEIIIQFLWQMLEEALSEGTLFKLKLWETNNNYFELSQS